MITNSCSGNRLFRRFSARTPPEAEPCDRMEEARGVRRSSRSRKTYGLIGELGAFSPGLKPDHGKIKRSRGFENPLPRTEVRGWHPTANKINNPATRNYSNPHLYGVPNHEPG